MKKIDFKISFRVETDIFEGDYPAQQHIYLGIYSIPIEEEDALRILRGLSKEQQDEIEQTIKQDYIKEQKAITEKSKPRKKAKKAGYIYLLESGGLYKIGRTANFQRRMVTYKTESPLPVKVISSFHTSDTIEAEESLLEEFKEKRERGEWFALDDKDIQRFNALGLILN